MIFLSYYFVVNFFSYSLNRLQCMDTKATWTAREPPLACFMGTKVRLNEEKTKFFLSFLEWEYLRDLSQRYE